MASCGSLLRVLAIKSFDPSREPWFRVLGLSLLVGTLLLLQRVYLGFMGRTEWSECTAIVIIFL